MFWTLIIALLFAFIASASAPLPGPGYTPRIVTWFWSAFAWTVSRRRVADWLIRRATRTPYTHLPGYMNRYWLLNAYGAGNYCRWLPSIRVHHILRRDSDSHHKHDHPWDARTVILKGYYRESRITEYGHYKAGPYAGRYFEVLEESHRGRGDTSPLPFGDYHSITQVPDGGAWTLFITFGRHKGTWGFLVEGVKVPWHEYMQMYPEKPWASEEPTS